MSTLIERLSDQFAFWGNAPIEEKRKASSIDRPTDWLKTALRGMRGNAGKVTQESALRLATAHACMKILGESVAGLEWGVFENLGDGNTREAIDHPAYNVLVYEPSPLYDPFIFKETTQHHVAAGGNAISRIVRDKQMNLVEMEIWDPDDVKAHITGRNLYYENVELKKGKKYKHDEIFHLKTMATDFTNSFTWGLSPISSVSPTFQLAQASQDYGNKFYENGAHPSGILEHPNVLSVEAQERLEQTFEETYAGPDNIGRMMILEEGMKYSAMSAKPGEAQFLETRRFQKEEIASIWRIPMHLLQNLDKATYSNIEQQTLDFVVHTLRPWLKRWEHELNRKIFLPHERGRFFVRFNLDSLLRGDTATRGDFYAKLFNIGAISQNEIRQKENMNKIENGDEYYVPLNLFNPKNPINDETKEGGEDSIKE